MQLENDGGKLLGMTRGVEAPTFPQFVQVTVCPDGKNHELGWQKSWAFWMETFVLFPFLIFHSRANQSVKYFSVPFLVFTLGRPWKVEQPLEAVPSPLHPLHRCSLPSLLICSCKLFLKFGYELSFV